jgi:hypothetical protein
VALAAMHTLWKLSHLLGYTTTGVRHGGNPKVAHLISLCVLFPLDTCRIDSLNV